MSAKVLFSSVEFVHQYNDLITPEKSKVGFASIELSHNYYDIKPYGQAKVKSVSLGFEKRPELTDYIITN